MKVVIEKTDTEKSNYAKNNKFSFIFFIKMPINNYYVFYG